MRKQYHFRPSKNGYYAWDVNKLIEQATELSVLEIDLAEISTEQDIWPVRNCRSFAEHMTLVDQASLDFPIILSPDNRVMDGLHRVIKAYVEGHKKIRAVRFDELPTPDFEDVQEHDLPYDDE